MTRYQFPPKVTTRAEADALLDQLIPARTRYLNPYENTSSFAETVKHQTEAFCAIQATFLWIHETRPKIYKRCRYHFFQQLTSRLDSHLDYWRRAQAHAYKREYASKLTPPNPTPP